ncbi:Carboxyl-terminal protease [uncultured spirochete]|uniref:Carboxyl-terminal protease n=1 Tax=uncultured spirochete TaxID=156406 RepID=A0A3P3XNN5_9SPIR|nr:Carboxyl-terminal protease [uncultured spirochete]
MKNIDTPVVRKRLISVLSFVVILALTFVTVSVPELYAQQTKTPDAKQYSQLLQNIFQFILQNYVDEPDPAKLYQGAIKGMMDSLNDPYSTFLDEDMMSDLMSDTTGTYGGVGLYISKQATAPTEDTPRYIEVVSPIEDTPAWKEGIRSGDLITKIDGEDTAPLSADKASAKIRGEAGTTVTLTFKRGSYEFEVTFTRSKIEIPAVKNAIITTAQGDVGYIRIIEWNPNTEPQMKIVLQDMKKKGIDKFVLDVRSNPGGLLSSVVDVSDLFLSSGVIVSTKGRTISENYEYKAKPDLAIPQNNRMIVLINQGSASASEIFAGAMKDTKRALLLGEKTYGKGSVQQIFPLDKAGFKLTMAHYYTPSDVNIDKIGIEPDISVAEPELSDKEFAEVQRLYDAGDIARYLQSVPQPTPEQRKEFAKELAKKYAVPENILEKLVRDETERSQPARVYDLEYDVQLQKALDLIATPDFENKLKNTKTMAQLHDADK